MRDEAKAQREFERAIKETAKQETALARERKMIEDAREHAASEERALQEARLIEELKRVSEAQRTEYEARFRQQLEDEVSAKTSAFTLQLEEADARILELEAQRQRTKSMAEQVKAGTVYIISNIGSFGEKVFKVGQTRRLDYMERIDELGDASVPFKFDVHAHILATDAPKLENHFHAKLVEYQMNKMNWRKEFFKVDLSVIRDIAVKSGFNVEWTMEAAAEDYRNTLKLETEMAASPEAKERWIRDQLGIEHDQNMAFAPTAEDADD
ncbi:MAG: GIY-YIG nuclease family protein [Planctomycetota bacterium]|nr:GIY-YIG nuclease family protein [Planctomycetota bacterium]MDA1106337.1 GIY-YIG nuclease family protein [Planctomycetota bacterium]